MALQRLPDGCIYPWNEISTNFRKDVAKCRKKWKDFGDNKVTQITKNNKRNSGSHSPLFTSTGTSAGGRK